MRRARKLLPQLLGAAALTAALVAVITAFSGIGYAQSAAAAQYAPKSTAPPTITGHATVGQVLTATTGTWKSDTKLTFTFQWTRCDTKGSNCIDIANQTAQTYTVAQDDAGHALVVEVTAKNASGSTTQRSKPSGVVGSTGPEGAIKLQNGKISVPASGEKLPNRLIIDGFGSSPSRLSSREPFTIRVHVSDTDGNVVRDALVYAIGLPYNWAHGGVEVRTGMDGWANLVIRPTRAFPLRGHALVMFLRARVEGQNLLGGVSTRRLVQVTS